jgi:hypothetical protein
VKNKRLLDTYRFPGFRPLANVCGIFGDSKAIVIRLERKEKKLIVVHVENQAIAFMITELNGLEIFHVEIKEYISNLITDESIVRYAGR